MKVFIIFAACLAVSLASGSHQVAHEEKRYDGRFGYAELQIGHDGVPIDTPEVQHAREAHLAIIAKARAAHAEWERQNQGKSSYDPWANGNRGKSSHDPWAGNSVSYESSNSHNVGRNVKYDGQYGYAQPKIGHDGVPIDTPEVQHARSAHLSAISEAKTTHSGWAGDNGSYGGRYGSSNLNYLNPQNNLKYDGRNGYAQSGVPLDSPQIQKAKVIHLATISQPQGSHSKWAGQPNERHRRGINDGHSNNQLRGHQVDLEPVSYAEIGPDGLPLDTAEVRALKQAHLAAHSAALDLIERQRKLSLSMNGEYDNGAWRDDTLWKKVDRSSSNVYNNQMYVKHAYQNNEPVTSHMNQQLESGPHTKISMKSRGFAKKGRNNHQSWNNEAYNMNNAFNNDAYNMNNAFNNEAYNMNNAFSNEAYNNNVWKNVEPATSHMNQQLESGRHMRITWKNNPFNDDSWNNIGSTPSFNNQNVASHEQINSGWNNSRSSSAYKGPFHVPKIGQDGVPEYTPEVQLARDQHLAALAAALERTPLYKQPQQEFRY